MERNALSPYGIRIKATIRKYVREENTSDKINVKKKKKAIQGSDGQNEELENKLGAVHFSLRLHRTVSSDGLGRLKDGDFYRKKNICT
ncbi:hypothetical protein NPIL_40461 [Nephila pilipes]|uniref:Uncharacterized protein n=1 Tax=Nephila pilipes TaxID=299642 RepID=A0A8X6Q5D3_NEPPI|nr:hypothetical protein NPIL_40461 [Nephila pilipes]